MSVRVDVISIGTLSRNGLWNESQAVRTPHSTTTLVRTGEPGRSRELRILIDPGLPPSALVARLYERTGLKPADIDLVFLTNFRPAHRAGLAAFDDARWLLPEAEREAVEEHLDRLADAGDAEVEKMVADELRLLRRTHPPEDKLAAQVDVFPLAGFTPGTTGLLLTDTASTTLIAGDAVPTRDHLLAGRVLSRSWDKDRALESLREVYEIADTVVPGHDNWFPSPRGFGG
jgi:glyoxylase-like metal-dependent hydrolase (beta-lactamase superfamily II)